jgi:Leucine-rich repeat (LRR) protein
LPEQTESLDLSGRGITDLEPLVQFFSDCLPLLSELNLSDNLLTELPEDLTPLVNVANLNINGNALTDFEQTVGALATLPSLRSVFLNLYKEEQVDFIMRQLEELEFLNGLRVERDILYED